MPVIIDNNGAASPPLLRGLLTLDIVNAFYQPVKFPTVLHGGHDVIDEVRIGICDDCHGCARHEAHTAFRASRQNNGTLCHTTAADRYEICRIYPVAENQRVRAEFYRNIRVVKFILHRQTL